MTTTRYTDITESELAAIVADVLGECPVEVFQTGGGVATAFMGTPLPAPDGDGEVHWLALGPGWFDGPGWANAVFSFAEMCVGPDDPMGTHNDDFSYVGDVDALRDALRYYAAQPDWRVA